MAISIRGLCRLNIGLANNVFTKPNFLNAGVRFFYSEKSLGVTAYESTRFLFRNQFMSIEDTFRTKMQEVCDKEDGVIFTEDLKAMLHLAHNTETDMQLIIKMIERYLSCNKDLKFGTYTFGPVVMRMFYYLNEPNIALTAFKNPSFNDFFNQRASFQLLMCLLFKHNMHNEMKEIYDTALEDETKTGLISYCLVVMLGALYKQNNAEAFQSALKYWKCMTDRSFPPSCRSTTLLAALAIKQNSPEIAVEVLSTVRRQHFIDVRCIKVLAYMHLKKYVQIIPLFKQTLEQDTTPTNRQTYFADVIYALEDNLKRENTEELQELYQLIENLKKQERLTTHITLDENLMKSINFTTAAERNKLRTGRDVRGGMFRTGLRNIL